MINLTKNSITKVELNVKVHKNVSIARKYIYKSDMCQKFSKNQAALYIQSIIYRKVKNTHMYSKNSYIAKKKIKKVCLGHSHPIKNLY